MNVNYFQDWIQKKQHIFLILGTMLFCFLLLRIILVGPTYDEIWTLSTYSKESIFDILQMTKPDANNHLLNSIFIKFFLQLPGNEVVLSRLPTLLAFIPYAYFVNRISTRFESFFGRLVFIFFMLANPFVLDFFTVARGYGLMLAFETGSIFYWFKFRTTSNSLYIFKAMALSFLAVLANFSMFNLVITFHLFLFIDIVYLKKVKIFLIALIIEAILYLAFIFPPIVKLIISHSLNYGGRSNWIEDSLVSLLHYSSYKLIPISICVILSWAFVLTALLMFMRFYRNTRLLWLTSILFLLILINTVQHLFFQTPYPLDRTALYYYPIIALLITTFIEQFSQPLRKFVFTIAISVIGVNALFNFNLHKTILWDFDAYSLIILNKVSQKNKLVKIDYSWPFQSVVEYYLSNQFNSQIVSVKNKYDRDMINSEADYFLSLNHNLPEVGYFNSDSIAKTKFPTRFMSYPAVGVYVYSH